MNNNEYTKGKKGTYPSLPKKVSYFYLNFDTVINLHLKRSLRDFFRFFFSRLEQREYISRKEESETEHAYTRSKLISRRLIYTHLYRINI